MNDKYILRYAAIIEMMDNDVDHTQGTDGREVVQILEDIPAADVAPVVHGKWIGYDDTERFTAQCSLCGNVIDTRFGSNFCPNCGAKMDGGKE